VIHHPKKKLPKIEENKIVMKRDG